MASNIIKVPYWRLSSFYFFYFALLGCIAPYWALFLSDRGFTPLEIGELMGLFGLVRMIAPNVWRIGCGVCFVVFSNIYWADDFLFMACIMVGYGFFWAAVLPQFEVVTLNYLRDRTDDYSKIRIWGSIGFVVVVLLLGWVFDYVSVSYLPAFMLVMLLAIFICSLCVRGIDQAKHGEESEGFLVLLWRPQVLAFLVAAFLIQFSHGAYYTFFSLFLEAQGYSKTMIGFLWALGVMAEVLVFLVVHKMFKHVGYKLVLIASLFLAALRWYFTAHFSDVLWMLMLLQLTHAATFGTMHAVSMHYVHKYFNGPHQGQGQAFFASFTYGAGGALGTYVSGLVWQQDLGVTMFELAGLSALVGMVIALIWVKK